jgi:hypothetical protein
MKPFLISVLCLLWISKGNAQLFKQLGEQLKGDAQWRVRSKADQQIGKGLDSLGRIPKKIKDKNKSKQVNAADSLTQKNSNTPSGKKDPNQPGNLNASASNENDLDPQDGYITLALSATQVFTGGVLTISGESVKYKNFTQVEVTVSGPSVKDVQQLVLNADEKYVTRWNASEKTGEYTVTAKSSDKKTIQSARFTVYSLPMMEHWCDDNIDQTNKAYDRLKDAVEQVKDGVGSKDQAVLEKKLAEVKENVDAAVKLFNDLNTAGRETAKLARSGKTLSPNLAGNLSDMNNNLAEHARQMKNFKRIAPEHQPADNTICEYLVIASEACAAFSAFTNFWSRSLATIAKNIVLDKAVPTTVGNINNGRLPSDLDFSSKESSKIFSTALFDAESLTSKLGKAGFAGDLIQYTADFLLKVYCGVFKGDFKHDYEIDYRNAKGETWWKYGVKMESTFSLRYPKDKSNGKMIMMKGNLEGNATNFTFFADVEKEDGFQEGSKGKIQVIPLHIYKPAALPFATSKNDPMGFGAVARGVATPAYFNIPVDAEYDVDGDKIKIFLNSPLVDFTDLVATQFLFLEVGGDLLPYIKKMNFPIHKAASTIGSVIRPNNEFAMEKDSKGNLSFTGKGNKHLGDKSTPREIDLNFSITASKN